MTLAIRTVSLIDAMRYAKSIARRLGCTARIVQLEPCSHPYAVVLLDHQLSNGQLESLARQVLPKAVLEVWPQSRVGGW